MRRARRDFGILAVIRTGFSKKQSYSKRGTEINDECSRRNISVRFGPLALVQPKLHRNFIAAITEISFTDNVTFFSLNVKRFFAFATRLSILRFPSSERHQRSSRHCHYDAHDSRQSQGFAQEDRSEHKHEYTAGLVQSRCSRCLSVLESRQP